MGSPTEDLEAFFLKVTAHDAVELNPVDPTVPINSTEVEAGEDTSDVSDMTHSSETEGAE